MSKNLINNKNVEMVYDYSLKQGDLVLSTSPWQCSEFPAYSFAALTNSDSNLVYLPTELVGMIIDIYPYRTMEGYKVYIVLFGDKKYWVNPRYLKKIPAV